MPVTQLGAVPQVQLDALPLMTAQVAANGGTLSINPGGGVTRFWDGTAMGIAGAVFSADANGHIRLASAFISVYGCRSFAFILSRANAGAALAFGPINVWIQYRLSATDVPPTSLGPVSADLSYIGAIMLTPNGATFPAGEVAGESQRWALGFDAANVGNGAAVHGTCVMAGDNVRMLFTTGAAPLAGDAFTLQVWGIA